MNKYDHKKIEAKWAEIWGKTGLDVTDDKAKGEKLYHLVMFPYPSGDTHMGHWYNYSGADFHARYKKMHGFNVMSPIGFDAFGLPAENAAIKRNIPPAKWTYENIARMREQIKASGVAFDWTREIITSDPEYYKWTQWFFLLMYNNGLAYKKKVKANWCPKCQTVLANEQVIGAAALCERCETPVVQKELEQWLFKITEYADKLLEGLDRVDWPEKIKTMQRNWIGKSEGADVVFRVATSDKQQATSEITVFTTRPDTLFGATFMVLAPEHPLVAELLSNEKLKIKNKKEIEDYIEATKRKTELQRQEDEKSKTGVFTGAYAINPVNGAEIPIWIADYVLMSYGHGAVMAVPAHDGRDWDFAKKYSLPIIEVVAGGDVQNAPFTEDGKHVNSEYLNGLGKEEAIEKVVAELAKKNAAKKATTYRLRDWLISRQRYWGAPIPIVNCEKCGEVPVPEKDLPVVLPEEVEFKPSGESPLKSNPDFVNTTCPKCGGKATRETDTMDTFVCSSWYYFRYTDPKNDKEFAAKDKIKTWLPVETYIGGAEHAILHLLYSRFFTKVLHDKKYIDFDEPFTKLINQGMILGPDGQKMSKSKGNVIAPDEIVADLGADAVRTYLAFMGPFDQGGPWNPRSLSGVSRFLSRFWNLAQEVIENSKEAEKPQDLLYSSMEIEETAIFRAVHAAVKKVGEDIEDFKFNTAVSAMMECLNELEENKKKLPVEKSPRVWREVIRLYALILAPFAPFMTEEIWAELGFAQSIHIQTWPKYEQELLKTDTAVIVVQVNGKVRANIEMNKNATQEEVEKTALSDSNVKKFVGNQRVQKVVYIPGKILNIVI